MNFENENKSLENIENSENFVTKKDDQKQLKKNLKKLKML